MNIFDSKLLRKLSYFFFVHTQDSFLASTTLELSLLLYK